MGWHAEEGAGGGWSPISGVEGVVEIGDLGGVSVRSTSILKGLCRMHEEQKDEVDHIHLSAALTFQSPALLAALSIP